MEQSKQDVQNAAIQRVLAAKGENEKRQRDAIDNAVRVFGYLVPTTLRARLEVLPPGIDRDDLIQDGLLTLVKCCNGFDPNKNADFRTYLINSISNSISTGINDQSWSGSGRHQEWYLNKIVNSLRNDLGCEPTMAEIAEVIGEGCTEEDVSRMFATIELNNPTYMSDLVGDGNTTFTVEDVIPDPKADTQSMTELKHCAEAIHKALNSLPPRWREVVLYHVDGKTFVEIGEILSVEPARVGQILVDSKNRIKKWFIDNDMTDLLPDWIKSTEPKVASHREGRSKRLKEKNKQLRKKAASPLQQAA